MTTSFSLGFRTLSLQIFVFFVLTAPWYSPCCSSCSTFIQTMCSSIASLLILGKAFRITISKQWSQFMHSTMWLLAGGLEDHVVSFILTLMLLVVNLITIFSVCEKITLQGNDRQEEDSFKFISIPKFTLCLFLKIVKAHTYLFKRYFPPRTPVDIVIYIPMLNYTLHYIVRAPRVPLSFTGFGQSHRKPLPVDPDAPFQLRSGHPVLPWAVL